MFERFNHVAVSRQVDPRLVLERGTQRHQPCSKRRHKLTAIGRNRVRLNSKGFATVEGQLAHLQFLPKLEIMNRSTPNHEPSRSIEYHNSCICKLFSIPSLFQQITPDPFYVQSEDHQQLRPILLS
ncbi:hypothetical protein F511_25750 [Dorcoceras hygrometricum]|uniref:Uncharacterized protein n=1 Tax=Dorcoceras hygrometricum TaxID=472368 RepID=A0A2Z7AVG9_9LAMI|nr:hypothetical protein F511_25750 [Dorcoceras hygrometricum]